VKPLLAVVTGAAVGMVLRLAVDYLVLPPLSTVVVNVIGSFALGVLVARVWPVASPAVRAGLGPGLLGTFTTFSAVAVALVGLGANGEWMIALAYLAANVVGGLIAAWLGLSTGRRS